MRLHWIGTISGRAPPPDALPCTAPASKSGQGGGLSGRRKEVRSFVVSKAQSKRGGRGRRTINSAPGKCTKTATSKRSCFRNALPHTSNGGKGKACSKRAQRGGKVTRVPDCTGRGEGGEGTQARACGSRDEHVGRCWCQLTAPHCTGHRAHTRRASKREEWECEQKKKEEPKG